MQSITTVSNKPGGSKTNLLKNNLFSLEDILAQDERNPSISPAHQVIRCYDREARVYLLQLLKKHLIDYQGPSMIKLYKAPYKIDKKTKKKFVYYNSIYSATADQFSKMKSIPSQDMPGGFVNQLPNMERKESSATNQNDPGQIPVYQDELALSKFLEEYLDYFVDYIFKQEQMLYERNQSTADVSSSTKVLSDLIMIMEVDRVVLKAFNTLVAMIIHPEKENITRFLQRNCTSDVESRLENQMPRSQTTENNEKSLEYFILFIKESLKFILFGFFKRCRIITQILVNIKKNFQNDSKESIFAEMLSSNMRWVFLTIRTCIEKVADRVSRTRNIA